MCAVSARWKGRGHKLDGIHAYKQARLYDISVVDVGADPAACIKAVRGENEKDDALAALWREINRGKAFWAS